MDVSVICGAEQSFLFYWDPFIGFLAFCHEFDALMDEPEIVFLCKVCVAEGWASDVGIKEGIPIDSNW